MPAIIATQRPRIGSLSRTTNFASADRASRHERGYGSAWDATRIRILKRDRYTCQIGKRKGKIHTGNVVDHIVPKAEGGTDDDSNLQTVCDPCHREKTQAEANRNR